MAMKGLYGRGQKTFVDDREVLAGLAEVARRGNDLRPVFKVMRPILAIDVREHFRAEDGGPDDGGHWAPRSAASAARIARMKGSSIRRGKRKGALTKRGQRRMGNQLGRLLGAYHFDVNAHMLRMSSRVPWASAQQLGATVGRGSKLPPRAFMWASPRVEKFYREALHTHLTKAW